MSYVALATDRFEEVARFYGDKLRFSIVAEWDRPNARGRRFELGGLRLEILDNQREKQPLSLGDSMNRLHVVVEVDDIEKTQQNLAIDTSLTHATSWGTRMFQVRDPDGVKVTFLQWDEPGEERT